MLRGCVDFFCMQQDTLSFKYIHIYSSSPPDVTFEILSHSKNDLHPWGEKFREILTRHLEHNATPKNDLLLSPPTEYFFLFLGETVLTPKYGMKCGFENA